MSKNECPKCVEFDQETRRRMLELFGPDEITVMVMSLSSYMKHIGDVVIPDLTATRDKIPENDLRRLQADKQLDVAKAHFQMVGCTIGKCIVTFDPSSRTGIIAIVRKQIGVQLSVQEEKCPHDEKTSSDLETDGPGVA